MNTTITIALDLSEDTYKYVARIANLSEMLKRAAERELYRLIREELA
jgi:hypothetical protein